MNKLTFNRVYSYWDKVDRVPIRTRTKTGKVSEFKPTIDPHAREASSWQRTFDDAVYFQVSEGAWISRERFELTLDAEGI
jgi:hypothetical protein